MGLYAPLFYAKEGLRLAILAILPADDPRVRQRAKRVSHIDSSVQKLIDDMVDTMRAASGVGLAAPQVGVLLRVIVIELPEEDVLAIINPEMVRRSGERLVEEGCLCLPGYRGELKRSVSVTVKARDRHGRPLRIKATDLLAEALEHEIDHLNGILYFDHVESLDKLHKIELEPSGESKE
ncbi:MAG: peptide deformylase [Chloroflexi bacterium]|nr:peptide deformylase [Chloroflexota bacterium]